jgi:protocatechuate 3,4-dioxygenase alpha subunit
VTTYATASPTPGQTVGPFFGYALPFPDDNLVVPHSHPQAVRLAGRVVDGAGNPVPDALLELWQADGDGAVVQTQGSLRRDGWTFTGWGRAATDDGGQYSFTTITPGAEDGKAPFFAITVFARGLLNRLFTRAYLPDQPDALAADPLLASLSEDQRATMVAARDDIGYLFDIVLQGDRETVFLTYPRHSDHG